MSRQQSAVAGRQAIGSGRTSYVDAFDEMELPGGQRGEVSFSVEITPELGSGLQGEGVLFAARAVPLIPGLSPRTRAEMIPIRSMRLPLNARRKLKKNPLYLAPKRMVHRFELERLHDRGSRDCGCLPE
jgi:hypothetical protein